MLTRDSRIWNVLIGLSVIVGVLATLGTCDPHTVLDCAADPMNLAYYGIPDSWLPKLRLLALVTGVYSGVQRTSPLPHSEEGDAKITASGK